VYQKEDKQKPEEINADLIIMLPRPTWANARIAELRLYLTKLALIVVIMAAGRF